MAGRLIQATITNPGALGLNTEQAAAATREGFASVLRNGFFDEDGKLNCREGFTVFASGDQGESVIDGITEIFWWRKNRDTKKLMVVGELDGTATLFEMTTTTTEFDTFTSRGTLNSTDVHLVNCNGYLVIVEQGQTPKVWDGTGSVADFAAATGTQANPTGGVALSAFGRLFITDSDGKTVWGSELQPDPKTTGINWDNWFIDTTGNSGGSAEDGWTFGRDTITALGSISDLFVIAGLESILIFQDVNGTVTIADSISGVGCIAQKTMVNTGDDIVFLSNGGLRSLMRTLEKESPVSNDISAFVRTTFIDFVGNDAAVGVFHQDRQFYLISDGDDCYLFDFKQRLPGGARKCAYWTLAPVSMSYDPDSRRLYIAADGKVGEYAGYTDDGEPYDFIYKSAWLDFNRQEVKIVKKLRALIYRGDNYRPKFTIAFDWAKERERTFQAGPIPEALGVSEWGDTTAGKGWGEAEWGGYVDQVNPAGVNVAGYGRAVRYGIQFKIDGQEVGLHEMQFFAKLGRLSHVEL